MSAQIKIAAVGVPSERNTGIKLDVVSSADPAPPAKKLNKLNLAESRAMRTNNMPAGRQP